MQAAAKRSYYGFERVKLGETEAAGMGRQPAKRSYYGILNKLAHMSLYWHADVT